MPFEMVRNDITRMNVDAIVNAANSRGPGAAGGMPYPGLLPGRRGENHQRLPPARPVCDPYRRSHMARRAAGRA